jgi:predicted metal-dependent phosphoesterase TrpH
MRAMIIDFHTHSHASDGALPPAELIAQAVAAGVSQFAITDHDTMAGYLQVLADTAGLPDGFTLVAGVEMSCHWSNTTIHVVGLGMDVEHPVLTAGLERLDTARQERARIIARKLEKAGMPGALEGASSLRAGVSQVGRPDFAAWMVDSGYAKDANHAFDKYLGAGKLGDVKSCWPELAEVCAWITGAGGTAIIAHPLKYRFTRSKLRRLLGDFAEAGGRCMEVFSGRQTQEQTLDLCKLANSLDLMASVGSDFHKEYDYGPRLGVDVTRLPIAVDLWAPEVSG